MWGVIPTYLTERFPTAARGVGPGLAYHAGAAMGSLTPTLIGRLKDGGMPLNVAMAWFIGIANMVAMLFMWMGPEPRPRVQGHRVIHSSFILVVWRNKHERNLSSATANQRSGP